MAQWVDGLMVFFCVCLVLSCLVVFCLMMCCFCFSVHDLAYSVCFLLFDIVFAVCFVFVSLLVIGLGVGHERAPRWKPSFSVGHWAGGTRVHGTLVQKGLLLVRSLGRGNR